MFCYVRLLTGYPRSKTRAPECFEQTFKGGLSLRAKSGSAPGTAVAQSVVRSRHHWWSWSPSVWNTPVDLWTFEKGANKQINKQTNKQTNHLSLKSLSISPFFFKPQQLKNHTHGIFHQHCSPPALLSPRNDFAHIGLRTGKRHGRITAHGVHAVNVADFLGTKRVNGSDHSCLIYFFEMRCYFPNEMRRNLTKSTDFNRWNISSEDRWFVPTHFASILWICPGVWHVSRIESIMNEDSWIPQLYTQVLYQRFTPILGGSVPKTSFRLPP